MNCLEFQNRFLRDAVSGTSVLPLAREDHASSCRACAAFAEEQARVAKGFAELRAACESLRAHRVFTPPAESLVQPPPVSAWRWVRSAASAAAALAAVWTLFIWSPRTLSDRSTSRTRSDAWAKRPTPGTFAGIERDEFLTLDETGAVTADPPSLLGDLDISAFEEESLFRATAVPTLAYWSASGGDPWRSETWSLEADGVGDWEFHPIGGPSLILIGDEDDEWKDVQETYEPWSPSNENDKDTALENGSARGSGDRAGVGVVG